MNKEQFYNEIKSYKLLANKSLGQNFLIDPSVCEKIINLLSLKKEDNLLEIGAGLGSLSYFLIDKPSNNILIDIDERMLQFLNEHFSNYPNVTVKRMNILKEDLSSYTKIVGNLPYYITSGIIEHILLNATNVQEVVLMVQKEVLVKLNSKEISPLSMFLKYVGSIQTLLNVSKNSFCPVPHVESAVFKFIPNENIKNENNKQLYKLITKLFLHRRKNILNNLNSLIANKEQAINLLNELNVEQNLRPEQLDIGFYIKLLDLFKKYNLDNFIK